MLHLDLRVDSPPGFTHWLADSLLIPARLVPVKRAAVRRRVAAGEGRKVSRFYDMGVDAIEAMEQRVEHPVGPLELARGERVGGRPNVDTSRLDRRAGRARRWS